MKKKIAVFCGSSPVQSIKIKKDVKILCEFLVKNNISVIYGGGEEGLMGYLANSISSLNGNIKGVITNQLLKMIQIENKKIKLDVVDNMHERKKIMYDFSSLFIILPGGIGTLEEFLEVLTWNQLKIHNKPVLVFNINNYFDHLIKMFDNIHKEGFAKNSSFQNLKVFSDVNELNKYLFQFFLK